MAETAAPNDAPWEPPLSGSEVDHLVASLDRLRTTFRWKADGLDLDGLTTRVGASDLTLASLLKHLACVEDEKSGPNLDGSGHGAPWAGMRDYDGPPHAYAFDVEGLSSGELYAMWDDAVARAQQRVRAAIGEGGLGQQVAMGADDGFVVSLRRMLFNFGVYASPERRLVFDLVEEYGRHTGHADLLREAVDGRVGEDPPAGWRAQSGTSPVGCR